MKVSGSRFYFLRGLGARLEIALMHLGLDRAVEHGFEPLITPTLVRPETMAGTGFLGEHAAEVYRLEADDLYLTGTSEVALAGFHADEILSFPESGDPIRYAGWSTCYRREAGSAGKDNRGILRVHQFNKLEMFSYVLPEQAEAEHQRLVAMQESMMQDLGLHYRVIDVAGGDLGTSAARKYDIEAWVPTQGTFRELTSTSNCTTFQARRLDTRYRTSTGKTAPVATLNGTLATTAGSSRSSRPTSRPTGRWSCPRCCGRTGRRRGHRAPMSAHERFVDGSAQGGGSGAGASGSGSVAAGGAVAGATGGAAGGAATSPRTKRWLVALDVDGTTMREDGVITDTVIDAVRDAEAPGTRSCSPPDAARA